MVVHSSDEPVQGFHIRPVVCCQFVSEIDYQHPDLHLRTQPSCEGPWRPCLQGSFCSLSQSLDHLQHFLIQKVSNISVRNPRNNGSGGNERRVKDIKIDETKMGWTERRELHHYSYPKVWFIFISSHYLVPPGIQTHCTVCLLIRNKAWGLWEPWHWMLISRHLYHNAEYFFTSFSLGVEFFLKSVKATQVLRMWWIWNKVYCVPFIYFFNLPLFTVGKFLQDLKKHMLVMKWAATLLLHFTEHCLN